MYNKIVTVQAQVIHFAMLKIGSSTCNINLQSMQEKYQKTNVSKWEKRQKGEFYGLKNHLWENRNRKK